MTRKSAVIALFAVALGVGACTEEEDEENCNVVLEEESSPSSAEDGIIDSVVPDNTAPCEATLYYRDSVVVDTTMRMRGDSVVPDTTMRKMRAAAMNPARRTLRIIDSARVRHKLRKG